MKRSLLCALLTMLLTSCGTSLALVPEPIRKCKVVPIPPAPPLDAKGCLGPDGLQAVCLTIPDALALAEWVQTVKETRVGLAGCHLTEAP